MISSLTTLIYGTSSPYRSSWLSSFVASFFLSFLTFLSFFTFSSKGPPAVTGEMTAAMRLVALAAIFGLLMMSGLSTAGNHKQLYNRLIDLFLFLFLFYYVMFF